MGNFEDRAKRRDSQGRASQRHPLDPTVRKESDVDEHNEDMQLTKVRRINAVPVPATGSSLFSDASVGPGRPAATAPSMTELLFSVLRFKWTILVVFILVAAPVIAAVWTQVIPQYSARGEVQIRPIIPRLVFRTDDNGSIPFYESFVNTQVSVMRNPQVLNRVLEQPDVRQTKWFGEPKKSLIQRLTGQTDLPMERLKDALSVQPRARTEIMDVSFSCASVGDAVVIVNAVLDQYMKYVERTASGQRDEEDRAREKLYGELKTEIVDLETIITGIHQKLGTATPQELISARRLRLEETEARIAELTRSIAILNSQVDQGSTADSDEEIAGLPTQPLHDQDPEWRALSENVRAIRHQIATSVLKPAHPGMIRLNKDLEFAEESLRNREAQLDGQWANQPGGLTPVVQPAPGAPALATQLMTPRQQLAQAEEEKKLLDEEYNKDKIDFEELFADAQELDQQNAILGQKREVFDQVRQVREQKSIESGVAGSIQVLTKAFAPSKPSEDRRVVFTAMALFMGLGMGGGAAFLRASRNQTIYAPKDMPPTLQAPFLGYIPLTRIKRPLGGSLHEDIQRMRDDKIESVRLVRTALLSRLSGQGSAAVLIASASEGTGKSTFTMMLGKSLAQSGKKVIMIDADLRRMTLSKRFGLTDEPGFMESLRSKLVDQRHIFSTETSGLSILPSGIPNGDGSVFEGTANGAFKACIAQLRRHFDIILLDSSPILPVADAAILSSQVDGTIMVERELVSRRANVVDALARLDAAGGQLMGTVFVGSRENGHYGYGYGYGYSKKQYS